MAKVIFDIHERRGLIEIIPQDVKEESIFLNKKEVKELMIFILENYSSL